MALLRPLCKTASSFGRSMNRKALLQVRNSSTYPINDTMFGLSDEQKQLRQSVFQFAQKEIAPFAAQIDKDNEWPNRMDVFKKLGDMGLLGIVTPEEFGGIGGSYMDFVIACEEISRAFAGAGSSYAAHVNLGLNQLIRYGTDEQRQKYIEPLITGKKLAALAMSEPSSGSDVVSLKTKAERKGDYYVLNGSKFWITNGYTADVIIVYARTDPNAREKGITAFIIEKGMDGFTQAQKMDTMGSRGTSNGELVFEDCKVPVTNVLGKEGNGLKILFAGLDIERCCCASIPLGLMQSACDLAFDYANQRRQFDQPISNFQLIQGKMADMYTALSSARSYVYSVARLLDSKEISPPDCAACILYAAESATKCAMEAVQILGGNGYINDYPAARLLRDAKMYEIAAGTSEVRRLVVARNINKEYR